MKRLAGFRTTIGALALLAGCGGEGEGGLSDAENRELNNAAEMLDLPSDSLVAGDEALGNGDAPAETGELPVTDEAATNAAE